MQLIKLLTKGVLECVKLCCISRLSVSVVGVSGAGAGSPEVFDVGDGDGRVVHPVVDNGVHGDRHGVAREDLCCCCCCCRYKRKRRGGSRGRKRENGKMMCVREKHAHQKADIMRKLYRDTVIGGRRMTEFSCDRKMTAASNDERKGLRIIPNYNGLRLTLTQKAIFKCQSSTRQLIMLFFSYGLLQRV